MIVKFIYDLLIILAAGLAAGMICKRLGTSMLIGFLLAGAAIGHGGLGLVAEDGQEIEYLARVGALLLLFAIGIEFSLEELVRLSRPFFVGGSMQMVLIAAPVAAACVCFGVPWPTALLIASATALSSTVLVFRALTEWGETASPAGRRAIAILLFQDVALVPLMLMVPLLTEVGQAPQAWKYLLLAMNSILFVAVVVVLRKVFARWVVPMVSDMRSVELVILFTLTVLMGFCVGAAAVGLPPALGAFAAGLALNGNRLTGQIDAMILPYRESFGAVFFVSLGTLLNPSVLWEAPGLLILALLGVLAIKAGAATMALRATGLPWRPAAGMGLGLAQLGEFSFVLLSEGVRANLITAASYSRMLFLAIGTLIFTPPLLKLGLRWTRQPLPADEEAETRPGRLEPVPKEAVVIGLGPIGRQAASRLEILGVDVCLIDLSPVNLYDYAQQGFRTVSGDARESDVLDRADATHCRLAVIAVPDDKVAGQIVKAFRSLNDECTIVVRCRYRLSVSMLEKAGASAVVSEEAEASVALLRLLRNQFGID
ncbi:MAG TPA: cation:proton antiporter [Thermoguttaceae bacterium]|nr:cation:proton antiporter [Thermoguttaceae bacterium]